MLMFLHQWSIRFVYREATKINPLNLRFLIWSIQNERRKKHPDHR